MGLYSIATIDSQETTHQIVISLRILASRAKSLKAVYGRASTTHEVRSLVLMLHGYFQSQQLYSVSNKQFANLSF